MDDNTLMPLSSLEEFWEDWKVRDVIGDEVMEGENDRHGYPFDLI